MKTREWLIAEYKDMICGFGEYDVWDDDIAPKLDSMTDEEIRRAYEDDLQWYGYRENMIQV